MLNVLDEKWKDHLYDLDQLRGAIHYRSWGQKDPLIEYKQEAYSMFVDLMNDIFNTFTERFFRAQLVFQQPNDGSAQAGIGDGSSGAVRGPEAPRKPTKRYNALGILEDIPEEEPASSNGNGAGNGDGTAPKSPAAGEEEVMDVGPDEPPKKKVVARQDPVVVGAGRARSLNPAANVPAAGTGDWSNVGRNDPCPCGSGKKFKKCHGATM